jgi:hypothetical protein
VIRCPSDLQLEVYLLSPDSSGVAGHVGTCTRCGERLAAMRVIGEEFLRDVFPATRDRIVAEARHAGPGGALAPSIQARARWRWLVVAAPVAAAIAAVLLLAYGPYWRGKAIDLAVFVDASGTLQRIRDGAVVPASAELRFRVRPGAPCNLWVLSVNGEGDIVRLYPPKGDRSAERRSLPPSAHDLPAVAALDGRPGPQRIFAVCTQSPVPWNTVKTAAAERLGSGAEAVRAYRSIPGLPAGASQTTLLLEKRS